MASFFSPHCLVEIIDFSVVTRYRPRMLVGSDGDSIEGRGGKRETGQKRGEGRR